MAYFVFVDESGIDKRDSVYEVLCGVAIEDRDLWNIISALKHLEIQILGTKYRTQHREIKGRKFLKRKTFIHAQYFNDITSEERTALSKKCIENGGMATKREQCALALAKLEYVRQALRICSQYRLKVFGAICSESIRETDKYSNELLRRDYVYFLERIYYYLEDRNRQDQGIIVFDELEKSESHILVSQIENYFKKTFKGQQRANLIIPEPFFVHSDLTTGIQMADIIAYIILWGLRLNGMTEPRRTELEEFVDLIKPLRYRTLRDTENIPNMEIWSIVYVK
jgi:hypothetical protein